MMQFKTKGNRQTIEFSNVQIINRNFRGEQTEYNRSGARKFSVILLPEEAEDLIAFRCNAKIRPSRNNPDEKYAFIDVSVNYQNIPPKIYRIVGDRMTLLSESTVGILDSSDIINVDLVVNCRYWSINGATGVKLYVSSMYVTVEEDAFAQKYEAYTLR